MFTRIDNAPFTAGFETESYPAHTFTGADLHVIGLRRSASLKTNCFVAALHEPTSVTLGLYGGFGGTAGAPLSTPITVDLPANMMVRFLDIGLGVFPIGDFTNGVLKVTTNPTGNPPVYPGVSAFCTVENVTTTNADFRIGKASPVLDEHAFRLWVQSADEANTVFAVGPNERNRHVVYFKHPDVVECALGGGNEGALEMRLYDPENQLRAGGAGVVGFANLYTGNKGQHGEPGVLMGLNGKWRLDVQKRSGAAGDLPYALTCRAGSGFGGFEWVGRHLPVCGQPGAPACS
jgi:hypothetical protein